MIDIVIVTYNRNDLLIKILEKLKQQTVKNYNVIICDDGSCKPIDFTSYPMIKKYTWTFDKDYHRVARFNEGVSFCITNKVILLDDDTMPQGKHWLETHCNNLDVYDVSRGIVRFLDNSINAGGWFSTTNTGFKVDKYKQIGGMDMNYDGQYGGEDVDLGKMVKMNNLTTSPFLPDTECKHEGKEYKNGDRSDAVVGRNRKYFFNKWQHDWLEKL